MGIVGGVPLLDLADVEDSSADVDMNVVLTGAGNFVEVQGTAEGATFARHELDAMLALAEDGVLRIVEQQRELLADPPTPRTD